MLQSSNYVPPLNQSVYVDCYRAHVPPVNQSVYVERYRTQVMYYLSIKVCVCGMLQGLSYVPAVRDQRV